jgi:polyribonucleotide nucleotidyltransferase
MIIREKVRIGDQLVTLETGRIAKQAGGSCLVRAGETIVLVTVCGNQDAKPGQSFFPLSVDYQEKTYSAGKIPGGFFKREGRLRDYEILVSRLIDRPCRPLFPEGYLSEVQVIATVMSFDGQNPPDMLAMIGASAALHISQIPWKGPIAGVRVGRIDGKFIANPTFEQIEQSDCELIVAASREAIVMVEGEADEISEDEMIEALLFGHAAVQDTLDLIDRMQQAVGKTKWRFNEGGLPAVLTDRVRQAVAYKVREACNIADKHARKERFKEVRKEAVQLLAPEFPAQEEQVKAAFDELQYKTMRAQVLDEGRRLDGRDTRTVRPISIELGVLPRVHGSSLFTRGETQAIVTTTLGTARDSQRLDTLLGDKHKHFMLHYNFPPYSVGEVKPMRGPGRREVGHGNLAERALAKMMPTKEEFPYAIRIVSEITESNGSSSMASVCGGSLAMMDAGVPLKAAVAGVAMGLIKEGEDYAVLTDILGDEDALGDMDFKVCGTAKGVTAIQMDIKVDGLSRDILERALYQARDARMHILDKMQRSIPAPRTELSAYAPRITQIRVKPDQVRTIIGPGGKMIRAIVDQTGASIDVEDDGTVNVSSSDSAAVQKALEIIKSLTTDPEIGEVYEGTVKRIEPYGAFIEILPGKDGLCHISDMDFAHVTNVEDFVNLGDKVQVKVTNIDRDGRIRLSRKDALGDQPAQAAAGKLNGRAEGTRDERPPRAPRRDERPARARDDEARPARARDEDVRPARPRDEDLRPARARDEDARPARVRDEDARPARARDEDVRPARARDEDARPARARDEDIRPARVRDEEVRVKPVRDFERDERPARARDEDARPARPRDEDARPARVRDEEVRVKPARDFERDERPAIKRDLDRDERPARPRFERDERPAAKGRDFERDERPAKRDDARELRSSVKPVEAVRDARPAVRERDVVRDEPRKERAFEDRFERGRGRDDDVRPARLRDDDVRTPRLRDDDVRTPRLRDDDVRTPRLRDDDVRTPRLRDDDVRTPRLRDDERPVRAREEGRDRPRGRDDEREPVRPRPRDDDARPARLRDDDAPRPTRAVEREERPARSLDRPTRAREDDARPARGLERDERPARPREDVAVTARRGLDAAPSRPREERAAIQPRVAREDEPRRREPGADERPARPRREDRFEPRSSARSEEDRPRPRDDERPRARDDERGRLRDSEPPARDARPVPRFEDDTIYTEDRSAVSRGDRTERERPSRTRERARNRERVRELERERR